MRKKLEITVVVFMILICLPMIVLGNAEDTINVSRSYIKIKSEYLGDYFLDDSGLPVRNQWISYKGNYFFIGTDGKIIPDFQGGWYKIGRTSYYYSSNGYFIRSLPESFQIDMEPLLQNPELPTGCESVALTMVLKHYGFELEKTEIADHYLEYSPDNFVSAFIGDPKTNKGAGCYAPAIALAANKFLTEKGDTRSAKDITGKNLDELYGYIADGKPVILWNSMYMEEPRYTEQTYFYQGRTYRWFGCEHCVVLCGFDQEDSTVLINDPLEGMITRDAEEFGRIYDLMGQMAVLIK